MKKSYELAEMFLENKPNVKLTKEQYERLRKSLISETGYKFFYTFYNNEGTKYRLNADRSLFDIKKWANL